ncbi:MAG: D-alanyl-D-alanine carboxypeptidase/D-alanyl-D-alanine-endopeptidase [Syntrophobacteraceae bacterium]
MQSLAGKAALARRGSLLGSMIWLVSGICLLSASTVLGARVQSKPTGESSLSRFYRCAVQVGFQVIELPSGRVLVEHRAHEPLVPASVVKTLTSFTALKWLGPEHHFRTAIWTTGRLQGGALSGPIYVKGDGDPFFVQDKLLWLVRRLKESGVERIMGSVYVDNSYFSPQTERVCLDDGCNEAYNPTLSGTALEFNSFFVRATPGKQVGTPAQVSWYPSGRYLQVENLSRTVAKGSKSPLQIRHSGTGVDGRERIQVTGSISLKDRGSHEHRFSVFDPGMFVTSVLHAALVEAGVGVDRSPGGAAVVPSGARKLVEYESNPLSEICCGLNRYSNNFMAEMLLRSVGGYVLGSPGTESKGLSVVQKALLELGVPAQEVSLKTGSGLSRDCRVSSSAFCRVLAAAYADPGLRASFSASLAVAGQEGTLRNRMKGSSLTVRGKTGTLRDVVGFSGYVEAPTGQTYGVTVLMNDVKSLQDAKSAIDGFLEEVATGRAK